MIRNPRLLDVMRPRLLDLFACEGVGAKGYDDAGFDVYAVDTDSEALSRNPYMSIQADALMVLCDLIRGYPVQFGNRWNGFTHLMVLDNFDAIHASPPCQASTTMSAKHRGKGTRADEHVNLVGPTRDLLIATDKPWVLENVVGARSSMVNPILLHGGMFGLGVDRPRLFDSNILLTTPQYAPRCEKPLAVYGKLDGALVWRRKDGSEQRRPKTVEQARAAMGAPNWATWRGCCEAIPPAYTRFVGEQLLAAVEAAA